MSKASPKDAGSRTAGFLPPDLFPFRKREEGRPMNQALAHMRHLADQLADAANLAREVAAKMADAERQKGLEPDEIRRCELSIFARVAAEVEQNIHPGSSMKDLRFSRDELKAIVMHSDQSDIKEQARKLIDRCNSELSERARQKKICQGSRALRGGFNERII